MGDRRVSLSADAVFTRIDEGGGIVLELRRKRYYLLNESATALMELLQNRSEPMSPAQLASRLIELFDVDEATARADLDECLDALRSRGVIRQAPAAGPDRVT